MKTSPGDAKVKFSNLQKSSVLISFAGVPATQLTQLEPFLKGFVFGTKILDWRPVKFGKIMTRRSRSMSPAGKKGSAAAARIFIAGGRSFLNATDTAAAPTPHRAWEELQGTLG
ncbi:hypothetical protein ABIB94_008119 [Bradyrhizobium sp. JR7.2]|jgi:hypothetical protein|uniref:Uncharacterized protein n=1 Tax=Bradyrhizobium barranii TaxID=2992140 RepID=A0ABY3QZQ4_9BRAD|nr:MULTISPECIES: hypothetical protein [Bradyrhizobium]UFW91533.1 hypothetical protein BjapCC829_46875 [Bradyrhizobium japonicum]WFU00045.1 hypothetical protein QA633_47655 [Bradyrhizobium barranii]